MLSLVALVFTSLSVGMVTFQIINRYIPDSIGRFGEGFSSDILRFAIAALIVATPLFFLISRQIYKNLFKGILAKEAGVRKWLTYFILLISSLIILGWLIGLINNYLGGELTLKFILKAIAAVIISAIAFTFYLYDSTLSLVNETTLSQGSRNINFTNLADINEEYYYNVTIRDKAGNENSTLTRKLTLDSTNPIIDYDISNLLNNTNQTSKTVVINVTHAETNPDIIILTGIIHRMKQTNTTRLILSLH